MENELQAIQLAIRQDHGDSNGDPSPTDKKSSIAMVDPSEPPRKRSRTRLTAIVVAIHFAVFITALDQTILATCLPTIARDLNAQSAYSWIGSVYLLSSAAAGPLWSNWSNIWGRKPMILCSIAIFFVSSIICALAQNIGMLIAGRVLQGLGGGGVQVLAQILISDIFSMRARTIQYGLWELVWAVAAGSGPVLGGVLSQTVTWRWVFWINLPVAGVAFTLMCIFLDVHNPRTKARDGLKAIDWLGGISVIGLTTMLLLGLDFGGENFPWQSPTVICLVIFGVAMFGVFMLAEKWFARQPILPLGIFGSATNFASLLGLMMQSMVSMLAEFYLPLFFQSVRNASPITSGVLLIPFGMAEALTALAAGIVINYTGRYVEVIWLSTFVMTVGAGTFVDYSVSSSMAKVICFQIFAGLGVGGLFQPYLIAVQAQTEQKDHAAATATLGFGRDIAGALALVIGSAIVQNSILQTRPSLVEAGLSDSLVVAFTGNDAVANVDLIGQLKNGNQRQAVEMAYSNSMRNMWIFMTAASAVGLACSPFIKRTALKHEHTETKTGLLVEEPLTNLEPIGDQQNIDQ